MMKQKKDQKELQAQEQKAKRRGVPGRWERFLVGLWPHVLQVWSGLFGLLVLAPLGNAVFNYWLNGKWDQFRWEAIWQDVLRLWVGIVVIAVVFLLLTVLAYRAFRGAQKKEKVAGQSDYVLKAVEQVDVMSVKLFQYVEGAYIERNEDEQARKLLTDLAQAGVGSGARDMQGICIVGKTRLAWETIQRVVPKWTFVRWSHERRERLDVEALWGEAGGVVGG